MNIEEIKDRVNLTKNAFHKLGIEGQVNINVMLNDIEFLLKEIERTNEILIWKQKHEEQLQSEIERLKDKLNKIYNEIDNKNSQLVKALNYKLFIEGKIKAKIEIRKEEKENCKDSIEEKYLLREIYVLQSLLKEE